MGAPNALFRDLSQGAMPSGSSKRKFLSTPQGFIEAYGNGAPPAGAAGYAPGCFYHRVDGSTLATCFYVNIGTKLVASWTTVSVSSVSGVVLADNASIDFGDGTDIRVKWDATKLAITQAAPDSAIHLGVSGAGIDLNLFGDTVGYDLTWDQSANSLIFKDNAKLVIGTGSDIVFLWDGTDLLVSQATANSIIKWGVSGAGINHVWYGDTATYDMQWDQTNNQLNFLDNAKISIGTGNDIVFLWDATDLLVSQATADSIIKWGVSGAGINHVFYGDTATYDCTWDQTNDQLLLNDNANVSFGTGAGAKGDVRVYWDAAKLMAASLTAGVWVNPAPSRLDPNYLSIAYDFEDDFYVFDPTATTGRWVVVEDDAACTQALVDDVAGGQLLLTNKAATDDNAQQVSLVSAPFLLAAGKHLWFECKIKSAAGATQVDVIAGLVALGEDLTGVADNRAQDGIVVFKSDGSTTAQFGSSKNGTDTGTNTNIGTVGTGWHTIGFYVNGVTNATPYFDGTAGTPITGTFCDDESLAPFFLTRNGDGVTTQTLAIDYVKVIQLR